MKQYLDKIFASKTTAELCDQLQSALDHAGIVERLPDYYERMSVSNPDEVQHWFDELKEDPEAQKDGTLKEAYGLFQGALTRLRELGFHRNPN